MNTTKTKVSTQSKILQASEVEAIRRDSEGQSIIHAHGVFDLLHVGHIRHLEQAKTLGDCLVVSLTPDRFVNKGPNRPAFTERLRAEALAAMEAVDFVVINDQPTAVELILQLRPQIFVKGKEFADLEDITQAVGKEAEAIAEVGGRIEFVGDITFSSSSLINQYMGTLNDEQQAFLEGVRSRYSLDEILSWLEKPAGDVVALMSETILDEYLFSSPLGQSSKDPILAVQQDRLEVCPGGGLAIANHLAGFCRSVHFVSRLGENTADLESCQSLLRPNVEADLLTRVNTPTIRKRRVVDAYSGNKLLEIYEMDDRVNDTAEDQALVSSLNAGEAHLDGGPLVVADYGHGLISPALAHTLGQWTGFLALNCQCNAGNKGMNSFKKYPRADYLCMAEKELQMEYREGKSDESLYLGKLADSLGAAQALLTRGKCGTFFYQAGSDGHAGPCLTNHVVDRVGAGDSVLAVTSLLLQYQAPPDIVNLTANAAGAIQVSELGNRHCLDRVTLSRFLTSLLK